MLQLPQKVEEKPLLQEKGEGVSSMYTSVTENTKTLFQALIGCFWLRDVYLQIGAFCTDYFKVVYHNFNLVKGNQKVATSHLPI